MSKVVKNYVAIGEQYARDVIAGTIPACKWTILACKRHFKDIERQKTDDNFIYEFNPKIVKDGKPKPGLVDRVGIFCESFPHTKGKWAVKQVKFVLEPWQCFLILSIFGWVYKSGLKKGKRRFTRAMLMVARKNGKSDLAARLGLYMFANDEEYGAEVYSGATTEAQAWEVFRPARIMALGNEDFQKFYGVGIMKSNINIVKNGSRFQPMIGKPGDGASPSCAVIDEYHEHLDDTQFDTMETGMVAREQPLALVISTAGDNLSGPCYSLQKDLEKILDGSIENDKFWGIIFGIDSDTDDWTSELALRKANPNYEVSVDPDTLKAKQLEAVRNSRKQGTFQTKHLNIWVGARQAFFNIHSWSQCVKPGIRIEDYKGKALFAGLDLASTKDIACLSLLFILGDGRFASFVRCYIPEAAIENGVNEHYAGWAKDGHLIVTDGNMIDYVRIEADIDEIHTNFGIRELAFDPAYAQRTVQGLMARGITCMEVRPTVLNFSAPMKHLDGLIIDGKIEHPDDPCMTWQMSNVVSKTDQKDNVYPNKERAEAKIDAPVATIMAMNRALISGGDTKDYQLLFVG